MLIFYGNKFCTEILLNDNYIKNFTIFSFSVIIVLNNSFGWFLEINGDTANSWVSFMPHFQHFSLAYEAKNLFKNTGNEWKRKIHNIYKKKVLIIFQNFNKIMNYCLTEKYHWLSVNVAIFPNKIINHFWMEK